MFSVIWLKKFGIFEFKYNMLMWDVFVLLGVGIISVDVKLSVVDVWVNCFLFGFMLSFELIVGFVWWRVW